MATQLRKRSFWYFVSAAILNLLVLTGIISPIYQFLFTDILGFILDLTISCTIQAITTHYYLREKKNDIQKKK